MGSRIRQTKHTFITTGEITSLAIHLETAVCVVSLSVIFFAHRQMRRPSIGLPFLLSLLFPSLNVVDASVVIVKRSPYGDEAANPPLFIDWTQPRRSVYQPPPAPAYVGCTPPRQDYEDQVRLRPDIRRVKVVGSSKSSEEDGTATTLPRRGYDSAAGRLPPCYPAGNYYPYAPYYPGYYPPPSNGHYAGQGRDYGPFGVGLFGLPSIDTSDRPFSPVGWLQGALFGGR